MRGCRAEGDCSSANKSYLVKDIAAASARYRHVVVENRTLATPKWKQQEIEEEGWKTLSGRDRMVGGAHFARARMVRKVST